MTSRIPHIRIGTTVYLDDGTYELVAATNGVFAFRDIHTGHRHLISHTELPRRLAEPPTIEWGKAAPISSETQVTEKMTFLAKHLQEIEDGTPLTTGTETRAEYNPATTSLTQRLRTKEDELRKAGLDGYSFTTLRRAHWKYRTDGIAGLADQRSTKKTKPLGRLDPRIREALDTVMDRQTDQSTGNLNRLGEELARELARLYPGENLRVPKLSSFRRYVRILDQGRHTLGDANRRRSAASAPKRTFQTRADLLPGVEMQIDGKTMNVWVLAGGKKIRPTLVTLIDRATRCVVAFTINTSVKGVDHLPLLAQALVPRPLRPLPDYFAELEVPNLPWYDVLDEDGQAQLDASRPFIPITGRIFCDNGADYLSAAFTSALERIGASPGYAPPGQGSSKGIIERFWGSVDKDFEQLLPGYCGNNVNHKGRDPKSDADILDIHTLIELFDRWVQVVYHHSTSAGLRDPMHPEIKHTPASMYAAMFDITGYLPVPLTAETYITLLPSQKRTIQADGIELNGRQYDSARLHRYRLLKDGNGKSRQHPIKWDPHNPAAVWFRDPETDEWITCKWVDRDAFIKPFGKQIRRDALEWLNLFGSVDKTAIPKTLHGKDVSTTRLLEALNEHNTKKAVAMRAAEVAELNRKNSGFNIDELTPANQDEIAQDEEVLPLTAHTQTQETW